MSDCTMADWCTLSGRPCTCIESYSHSERNTMGPHTDLDRFTDNELCQMHIDAGKRALAHYKRVENLVGFMSRMDVNDPDYAGIASTMDTCMWAGNEAHELQQEIDNVLRARRANADA